MNRSWRTMRMTCWKRAGARSGSSRRSTASARAAPSMRQPPCMHAHYSELPADLLPLESSCCTLGCSHAVLA